MPDATVSRTIAADSQIVWSLVSDVTRMGEWSPETRRCVWLKGATGPVVGARFKGENELGKRSWATTCEVIEADPGRAFSFRVTAGPLKIALWEYLIEADGDGCVVEERWTKESGRLIPAIGKLTTGVAHDAEWNRKGMTETLDRLAAVAEAS